MPTMEHLPEDFTMEDQDEKDQDETTQNPVRGAEGNAENETLGSAGFPTAISASRASNIHPRAPAASFSRDGDRRSAPTTVLMDEDIGCQSPMLSMSMPLLRSSMLRPLGRHVTPPSFLTSNQPAPTGMTRLQLMEILNQALQIMDESDGDGESDGDDERWLPAQRGF